MSWKLVFLVLLYRSAPHVVALASGLFAGSEAIRRGVTLDAEIIEESEERFGDIWPRWCAMNFPWTKSPITLFIDNEVVRVWPWAWPMWIGAKIAIQKRIWTEAMDRQWRR